MQLDETRSEMLIEEIVRILERTLGDIDSRLTDLEAYGFKFIHDMDEDRTDYPKGVLAAIGGGGLKQWTGTEWRTVMNGIEAVRVEDGDTLVVERSDGSIERKPFGKARTKRERVAV